MRDIFVDEFISLVKKNPKIILITADLGFGSFDEISKNFPDNFLNVGVAEQNMIGVAAGMAMLGRIPFCYSIGNFATLRCLEQIRNDAAYHKLPITIVSNGAGFSYGGLGVTHHATEDISVMNAIPELNIFSPSTNLEVSLLVQLCVKNNLTNYLRLDKSFHEEQSDNKDIDITKGRWLMRGDDFHIFCTGGITEEAIDVRNKMIKSGIEIGVASFPVIDRIDFDFIDKSLNKCKKIITLEENAYYGGLNSIIAQHILSKNKKIELFKSFSLPKKFSEVVGDQKYLRKYFKISSDDIINFITNN